MLQVSLDSHLNLSAGNALGANASETALDLLHPGNSFKRFCYSVSHGAMIDGSWNGEHPRWPKPLGVCNVLSLHRLASGFAPEPQRTRADKPNAQQTRQHLLHVQALASASRTRTSSSCTAPRPGGRLCWRGRCSRRRLPHGSTRRSTACPSLPPMQRRHDGCMMTAVASSLFYWLLLTALFGYLSTSCAVCIHWKFEVCTVRLAAVFDSLADARLGITSATRRNSVMCEAAKSF